MNGNGLYWKRESSLRVSWIEFHLLKFLKFKTEFLEDWSPKYIELRDWFGWIANILLVAYSESIFFKSISSLYALSGLLAKFFILRTLLIFLSRIFFCGLKDEAEEDDEDEEEDDEDEKDDPESELESELEDFYEEFEEDVLSLMSSSD